ncbi:MAG: hypothetical protein ACM3U2_03460, partial [Deltaproteobacteria bacterium]
MQLAAVACLLVAAFRAAGRIAELPANAYKGLVPGQSDVDAARAALGPDRLPCESPEDLRYPVAEGSPRNDRLYFRGGRLGLVTAASPDPRYPNRGEIVRKFGEPEASVRFLTQEYLDYTEKGLKFICDSDGKTTGTIYFAPARRRVPADEPGARIDLRREMPATGGALVEENPGSISVGTAELSIAPERLDNLTADAAEKPFRVAEDVKVRVAVFSAGATQIVFAGLDVFGMGSWDLDRLRESLAQRGFSNVVVAMSHTHANVDTIGFYGFYPREYAQFVIKQAEAAVLKAAASKAPVHSLHMGSAEMPLAGGRVVDLIRNGRDPGLLDPTVSVIRAVGQGNDPDKPVLNLVHLACHPEVIRLRDKRGLSPDYVGTLCREVTKQLGGQTVFLNGALGGMITPDARFSTQEAAEEMGRKLAGYAVEAARQARPSSSRKLMFHRRQVEYPITGESVVAFLKKPPEPIDFHQGRMRAEMNVVWIGDAQFITVPGELLPDIGLELVSHMRGRLRMIVGLANGELGYMVPSFDFRAGGYEERTGPGAAGGVITR